MLIDNFNRKHDYLRISLTDNCNFRCFYCMPEEDYDFTPASRLMRAEEIIQLARLFVAQGIKKIRLTGGEPLVRKDAREIISELGNLPVELVITSNGTRIGELLEVLRAAGVKTINISLDTLDREKFQLITRRDAFDLVKSNIELLLKHEIVVKINMVIMKGLNDNEILDFVEWTKYSPIQIRFIEFMPFTGNRWSSNKVVPMDEILKEISSKYQIRAAAPGSHDTAKTFTIEGHKGNLAIISTMSEPFCSTCNRLRLTADGKLKNCLFSAAETDLLTALRAGQAVLPLIQECVRSKKKGLGGQLPESFQDLDAQNLQNRSMIAIGG